jgi:hypothetical protein
LVLIHEAWREVAEKASVFAAIFCQILSGPGNTEGYATTPRGTLPSGSKNGGQ